ncbi:uncharacterized protein LOC135392792 [Ornithodoros turicata]|uniref:uncharacterized protein LOC135392792 n=1 Tax=Ornithodoros turicata TaxID=34597 RepID=UPI0031392D1A
MGVSGLVRKICEVKDLLALFVLKTVPLPWSGHAAVGRSVPAIDCHNVTKLLLSITANLTARTSNFTEGVNSTSTGGPLEASQRQALLYIVVVLFFYSFGIGFMMIRYMRQEAKEQEECKMYRRYVNAAHEQYLNSTNRARLANRLALQALNTVNAIPQTTHVGSKVTFV